MFSVLFYHEVPRGHLGFSLPQRKWAMLSINQDIDVKPFKFQGNEYLSSMLIEVDFHKKNT